MENPLSDLTPVPRLLLRVLIQHGFRAGFTVTRVHQISGIACIYPENWQLSEDREHERLQSFTLQSPNTAFMSVYVSRNRGQAGELIQEMTEMLTAEYEEVESSPVDVQSVSLGNDDFATDLQGVDLNFYFLDLLVTARLIAFSSADQTILVQCQAEDREFDSLEMVFKAMLISMLQGAKQKASPNLG